MQVERLPTTALPTYAAAPFWDDLVIFENTDQGVWWQIIDDYFVIEWIVRRADYTVTDYVQFQLVYYIDSPGVLEYRYFITGTSNGRDASVGVQGGESMLNLHCDKGLLTRLLRACRQSYSRYLLV